MSSNFEFTDLGLEVGNCNNDASHHDSTRKRAPLSAEVSLGEGGKGILSDPSCDD